jgi:hypothetical protein
MDVKAYVMRKGNKYEQELNAFLDGLKDRRVLYYPASGLDWEPLQTFSTACDVFVYCDWTVRIQSLMDAIRNRREGELNVLARSPKVAELTNMDGLPWNAPPDVERGFSPWCLMAKLRPDETDKAKLIQLVYFGANPVSLYTNLFTARQMAPLLICLNRPADVALDRWQAFVAADGPLANAVRENPLRPHYVSREIFAPALP